MRPQRFSESFVGTDIWDKELVSERLAASFKAGSSMFFSYSRILQLGLLLVWWLEGATLVAWFASYSVRGVLSLRLFQARYVPKTILWNCRDYKATVRAVNTVVLRKADGIRGSWRSILRVWCCCSTGVKILFVLLQGKANQKSGFKKNAGKKYFTPRNGPAKRKSLKTAHFTLEWPSKPL